MDCTNKPLAVSPFISYRYKGRYGWIMIGAMNDSEALREAERSFSNGGYAERRYLQKWNEEMQNYVHVLCH